MQLSEKFHPHHLSSFPDKIGGVVHFSGLDSCFSKSWTGLGTHIFGAIICVLATDGTNC